jgi:hypothetical protein
MHARKIAAFLLVVYAVISVSFLFHNHATEQPGDHCGICQILHAPGYPLAIATYDPILTVQAADLPALQLAASTPFTSTESQRAPPSL